jgi:AAA domain
MTTETQTTNDHLVLVSGKSTTGKSASLMGLENQAGAWYAGCEAGKKLPFKSKMREFTITDPLQIYEMFEAAEAKPEVHTLIIDTLTYLMDMYESVYVIGSADTQKAWGEFAQFYKKLMQQYVAGSSKNVIFLAHTADQMNKAEMAMETFVPVKGSLAKNGIESYFSCVISTKKMTLKDLKDFQSPLLTISEEDEALGFKHVFQTRLTKETVGERIRSPLGMWDKKETYIDNNIQLVMNRLREYYA